MNQKQEVIVAVIENLGWITSDRVSHDFLKNLEMQGVQLGEAPSHYLVYGHKSEPRCEGYYALIIQPGMKSCQGDITSLENPELAKRSLRDVAELYSNMFSTSRLVFTSSDLVDNVEEVFNALGCSIKRI